MRCDTPPELAQSVGGIYRMYSSILSAGNQAFVSIAVASWWYAACMAGWLHRLEEYNGRPTRASPTDDTYNLDREKPAQQEGAP